MESNKVKVKIYGQEYVIAGEKSREEIIQVAAHVDTKMHEIAELTKSSGAAPSNIAVLSAVNITSEFFQMMEEMEELKRLNQMFSDIICQLRGATTNINQIARKLHTDGEIPNDSMLYFLNKNILKYRKESERIWQLIRRLIGGQIHMEQ